MITEIHDSWIFMYIRKLGNCNIFYFIFIIFGLSIVCKI